LMPFVTLAGTGPTKAHPSYLRLVRFAQRLGLPAEVSAALLVLAAIALGFVLVRARHSQDDLLLLSFLAMASLAASLHRTYDWVCWCSRWP